MHFHLATLTDYDTWATFRQELYADLDPAHSETEIHRIANDPALSTFLVFSEKPKPGFVIPEGDPIGMVEMSLRNIVDGCTSSPVAYLEGLYLTETWQRQGLGRELLDFVKKWAREQGCTELAVDTELDNFGAQKFYLREGFEETFRIVQYRMEL